jgi:arylsulfatase
MKRSRIWTVAVLAVGAFLGGVASSEFHPDRLWAAQPQADEKTPYPLDRTILPIPEPKLAPNATLDARNAKAPPRFEVKPPAGAPNVLIVLIDDMGFGQASAFGGPIHMPTL